MPYFTSSQEWVEQSVLLLEARPSTTRITTRYSIRTARSGAKKPQEGDDGAAKPPRGVLVLKTYDPVSGVTLKYRTAKAAEVSRLVYSALGRLGRTMAAVPAEDDEEPMPDAPAGGEGGPQDNKLGAAAAGQAQSSQQASQQGGTAKRKKKGRK